MTLRNEDRELQIKLAELQADVQINLTACFAFLAVFLAITIGLLQILYALPLKVTIMHYYLTILIILTMICLLAVTSHFYRKAQDARKRMKELRKRYVW